MDRITSRNDDFEKRRQHLRSMTDDELKAYFWELTDKAVSPLINLARTHTTPAIERSVLLRMGFSSIEAKGIVEKVIAYNLIGKGAGHVVYRYAKIANVAIRIAGLALLNDEGWDKVIKSFEVGNA